MLGLRAVRASVPSPLRLTPTLSRAFVSGKKHKPIAVAFDIDGVLKQGPVVLPEALRAIRMLEGENRWLQKVPYLFITNSGGRHEGDRAMDLTHDFQTHVSFEQVMQAHTLMQTLVDKYANEAVLMIGGPDHPAGAARSVLNSYGFQHVYTAHDLHAYAPPSFPYGTPDVHQHGALSRQDFSKVHFRAIFVFHDSRQWGRDIQYALDLMRSDDGIFGTVLTNEELHKRSPMPIYFSHGDLLWGNNFAVPRLGQGGFRIALEALYKHVTNNAPFNAVTFGKPELSTYEYANDLLQRILREATNDANVTVAPEDVWMIGDNPASDIEGANRFGWSSALVRTGVFRDVEGAPASRPTFIADNVEKAITEIMERSWST